MALIPLPKNHPYQADMPYAKQPLKAIYVSQRLFTSAVMCVWWAIYYSIMPRQHRPRPSWTVKCIIAVNFTRRIYKVTELAGVTWGTRDPDKECNERTLKLTRFEWIDPLAPEFRTGIIADPQVPFRRVGCFVWPKIRPNFPCNQPSSNSSSPPQDGLMALEAAAGDVPVIGIFMHGGGYCHMSAHEIAPTSQIPARLIKDKSFTEIHSVEYRLLQHAPFPAAVQDAATVYAHLVRSHRCNRRPGRRRMFSSQTCLDGKTDADMDFLTTDERSRERAKYRKENEEIHARVEEAASHVGCKIILIGDSAGGNLVLALARWIRDEGVLPPPDGLLLLSPSCDPSHAFPETPSSYIPRPHAGTDYLVDTPEPRALLQRTFLGHNPLATMHSPYVSPASMRVLTAFYGDAFASSVADLTIAQLDDDGHRAFLRTMISAPATPALSGASRSDTGNTSLGPFLVGPGPFAMSESADTSGSSEGTNGNGNGNGNGERERERDGEREAEMEGTAAAGGSPTSLAQPVIASPRGLSLFSEFPKTCIVLGDAERLEREVAKLVGAMERDGTEVRAIWVKDAPHDVLQMKWWDERVRDGVWTQVEEWVAEV